jgi:hypothetical protein
MILEVMTLSRGAVYISCMYGLCGADITAVILCTYLLSGWLLVTCTAAD